MAVKPFLYQIDTWPSSLASVHHGINNWLVVIPLCILVLLLLHACNVKIKLVLCTGVYSGVELVYMCAC